LVIFNRFENHTLLKSITDDTLWVRSYELDLNDS